MSSLKIKLFYHAFNISNLVYEMANENTKAWGNRMTQLRPHPGSSGMNGAECEAQFFSTNSFVSCFLLVVLGGSERFCCGVVFRLSCSVSYASYL